MIWKNKTAKAVEDLSKKLVDVEEPIWRKPEGMTFEDVEELKFGEVGIVAEDAGEVVADRGRIATKRIPDIPLPSPRPRMNFRPLLEFSDRDLIALAYVMKPGDTAIVDVPLEPGARVAMITLLKDPAKKRG